MTTRTRTGRQEPEYRYPDPLDTESDGMRFYHLDLETLGSLELWAEGKAVSDALYDVVRHGPRGVVMFTPDGFPISVRDWLHTRHLLITDEISRRARKGG